VKPRRANRTTPMGAPKCAGFHSMRFAGFMNWANLTKIPATIIMIAMTPHVSIFFSPFSPSLSSNVMISQKIIPKNIGGVLPGMILESDFPSPTR